jgi:hypothetical protein
MFQWSGEGTIGNDTLSIYLAYFRLNTFFSDRDLELLISYNYYMD